MFFTSLSNSSGIQQQQQQQTKDEPIAVVSVPYLFRRRGVRHYPYEAQAQARLQVYFAITRTVGLYLTPRG